MSPEYALHYETLGLLPGADAGEVKEAYFKLVRQFPPEKDPESFKRIRDAYDALKDGPPPEDESGFKRPDNPVLQPAIDYCLQCIREEDYAGGAKSFQKLLEYAPGDPWILLNLAQAQRLAGHPQKAVNAAQQLLKDHPDCREAYTIMAVSMYRRGWFLKALPAFEKAYELGEKSVPFLSAYVSAALDNGKGEEAVSAAKELLKSTKWTRTNVQTALELFSRLAGHRQSFVLLDRAELLDLYERFLKEHRRVLSDPIALIAPVVGVMEHDMGLFGAFFGVDMDVYRKADRILAFIAGQNPEWTMPAETMRCRFLHGCIAADKRLEDTEWLQLTEATMPLYLEDDEDLNLFAQTDAKLCILKNPKDLETLDIVRTDYPWLYETNREFLEQLASGEAAEQYAPLKRVLFRLSNRYSGSDFLKKYPEEGPGMYHAVKVHDGPAPYVRDRKKIGRNDPCPCGSGKKFKRCCMGKGIYD